MPRSSLGQCGMRPRSARGGEHPFAIAAAHRFYYFLLRSWPPLPNATPSTATGQFPPLGIPTPSRTETPTTGDSLRGRMRCAVLRTVWFAPTGTPSVVGHCVATRRWTWIAHPGLAAAPPGRNPPANPLLPLHCVTARPVLPPLALICPPPPCPARRGDQRTSTTARFFPRSPTSAHQGYLRSSSSTTSTFFS